MNRRKLFSSVAACALAPFLPLFSKRKITRSAETITLGANNINPSIGRLTYFCELPYRLSDEAVRAWAGFGDPNNVTEMDHHV